MFRYAITNRTLYPGNEHEKQAALLCETARWAADDIDFIQLREKDLPAASLAILSRAIVRSIARITSRTKLLINSRADVATATSAHGVHLAASPGELTPSQVRRLYALSNLPAPIISISCHTTEDVQRACDNQANAILFAPVFEKVVVGQIVTAGRGLDQLRIVCAAASPIPVYALGGVTFDNALSCIEAGATGVAGIRLFRS